MKISVVIPCYNGAAFLEKCVECVKNQTYDNIEIIIVDDLSTDNTKKVMKKIKKQYPDVILVYNKINCGPGGAKNEGLKIATGEYVMFIDCDDVIDNNYIELMLPSNERCDLVIAGLKKIGSDGHILYTRYFDADSVLWQNIFSSGKLYNMKWLRNNNISLPYGRVFEDIMLQAAILLNNPIYEYKNIAGYNYYVNTNSISHTVLCSFKPGSIEKEQEYLMNLKKYAINEEKRDILTYFSYRTMIWHLLKSGCKVGKNPMIQEYDKAFNFLNKEFPDFNKNKYINLFTKTRDKKIIKCALWGTRFLYKLHLSKLFFIFYGKVDFSNLWPNA